MSKLEIVRALIQDLRMRYAPNALVLRSWVAYEQLLSNPTSKEDTNMHVHPNPRGGGKTRWVNLLLIGLALIVFAVVAAVALSINYANTNNPTPTPENLQPQSLSQTYDLEIEALLLGPTGLELTDRSISAAVTEGMNGAGYRLNLERDMFLSQLEIEPAPLWTATNGAYYSLMLKPWETRSNRGDPVTVLCRGYYGGVEVPVQQTTDAEGYTTCTVQRSPV